MKGSDILFNKKCIKILKINAFTLAEVLITLGIIGVVAAMTLPMLIGNYKNQIYATQLKKSVNTIENAFKFELAMNGVSELSNTELWQTFSSSGKGYGNSFGSADQLSSTEAKLKKMFKIVAIPTKISDYANHGGDYRVYGKALSGKTQKVYVDNDAQKIYISDGSMIAFRLYPLTASSKDDNCRRAGMNVSNCQYVGRVIVDVNGDKNPNTFGRDMFIFEVSNIGRLIPWGSSLHEFVSANSAAYWKNNGKCGTGSKYNDLSNSDGTSCAGRLIENNWTFDY